MAAAGRNDDGGAGGFAGGWKPRGDRRLVDVADDMIAGLRIDPDGFRPGLSFRSRGAIWPEEDLAGSGGGHCRDGKEEREKGDANQSSAKSGPAVITGRNSKSGGVDHNLTYGELSLHFKRALSPAFGASRQGRRPISRTPGRYSNARHAHANTTAR